MALASAKAKVEVRVGKTITIHEAKDTKHTNMITCERCPKHPGVAMSKPHKLWKGVKLLHGICPLCEKEVIESGDFEQAKKDLKLMQEHYDHLAVESKQNKRQYALLRAEVESLREALENEGSVDDEQMSDYLESFEITNKRIEKAVAKEVQEAVKGESRGTLETLQRVQKEMTFLRKRLEASNGKSKRAQETSERALASVQKDVVHIRSQLEEGKIKWGSDVEEVKIAFDKTHDSLVHLKACLGKLHSKLHGKIKVLAKSFSNAEDMAKERHEEYTAKFSEHDKRLNAHDDEIVQVQHRLAKLESLEEAPTTSHTASSDSSNHPAATFQRVEPTIPEMPDEAAAVSQLKIRNAHSTNDASPKVVAAILSKIADFAGDSDASRVEIATLGGIPAIVTAMRTAIAMPNVQEQAFRALKNLAFRNADNKIKIANLDGIEAVVLAMKRHLESVGVQEYGCRALLNLATNADNQIKIANLDGIEAVVLAMKRHLESVGVQQYGCWALLNLATSNADNRIKIANLDGIEAMVLAMKRHLESVGVQQYGCLALANLAAGNADNTIKIANLDGIEAVVSAMERHGGSEDVQQYGCGALRNLSYNNAENRRKIAGARGIDAILSAMQKHEAAKVQEHGCWALRFLATDNSTNQSTIAAAGGTAVVERAIQLHSDLGTIINPHTFLSPK